MRKILIIMFVILPMCSMFAQSPGGNMGKGGPPPNGMPGQRPPSDRNDSKPMLEQFPQIPDLTLQQREKVGSIMTKEREDIEKVIEKNRDLEKELRSESSEKKRNKLHQKIDKNNQKIQEIGAKSDKKVKKILTEEQYAVFVKKREEFKFKQPPKNFPINNESDQRPDFRDRPQSY